MTHKSWPFRYERLEELPSVFPAGGFRLLGRRTESNATYFDCRSAGGVEMSFWVVPGEAKGTAGFYWGTGKGSLADAFATIAAQPLLTVLATRAFFVGGRDDNES